MDQSTIIAAAQFAASQMFALACQPVTWSGHSIRAIGDGIAFGGHQLATGGGLNYDMGGSIVFLKSDFTGSMPKPKDLVIVTGAVPVTIRLDKISAACDLVDPCITFQYVATTK